MENKNRFKAKFSETEGRWFLFDTQTETYGGFGYEKEKDAQERVKKWNKAWIKALKKKKEKEK